MNNLRSILSFSFFALFLFLTNPNIVQAQSCDNMAYFKEGQQFEISNYNKKGKLESTIKYKTLNVNSAADQTSATLQTEQFDKKGKSIIATEAEFICKDNVIDLDMNALMNSAMPPQMEGVEMTITQENVGIPASAPAGTQLEDGFYKVTTNISGIEMNTTIDMVNRKVEGTEEITTPAGTFKCLKITYTSKIKAGFMKKSTDMVVYINPEYGMIRNEMYERGKMTGHSELTKID